MSRQTDLLQRHAGGPTAYKGSQRQQSLRQWASLLRGFAEQSWPADYLAGTTRLTVDCGVIPESLSSFDPTSTPIQQSLPRLGRTSCTCVGLRYSGTWASAISMVHS